MAFEPVITYNAQMPDRDPEWLETLNEIAVYIRKSPSTVKRWYHKEAFPICHMPNGHWATTKSLIDTWLLARNRVERGVKADEL